MADTYNEQRHADVVKVLRELVELKAIKRKIENRTASEQERERYKFTKQQAWLAAEAILHDSPLSHEAASNTARDWEEDFRHENGCYQCQCIDCGNPFLGHKRRVTCKVCAARSSIATPNLMAGRMEILAQRLKDCDYGRRGTIQCGTAGNANLVRFNGEDIVGCAHVYDERDRLLLGWLAENAQRILDALSAPSARLAPAWISTEDREPPKDGKAFLAFFPQFGGYIADQRMKPIYWTGESWQVSISGFNIYEKFTHWMPLPSAPTDGTASRYSVSINDHRFDLDIGTLSEAQVRALAVIPDDHQLIVEGSRDQPDRLLKDGDSVDITKGATVYSRPLTNAG